MKKSIVSIIGLAIFILASLLTLVYFSEMKAWQLISEVKAPNGEFEARIFRYISDMDRHAPYGNYVYIRPQSSSKRRGDGHVVFAGYCKNGASVHWVSNTNLNIICQIENETDIRTLSTKVFGIDISIKSV